MKVYSYHYQTGEFVGVDDADESPLEPGVFLIPANATAIKPPAEKSGFVRRFVNGSWGYSPIEAPQSHPTEEPTPYVPESISDRQFFHILAKRSMITQEEALQAVKNGDLPAALEAYVASLPDDQEFDVRMLLEGGTEFRRDHPLTAAFGAFFGMIPAQIDELFIEGAQI